MSPSDSLAKLAARATIHLWRMWVTRTRAAMPSRRVGVGERQMLDGTGILTGHTSRQASLLRGVPATSRRVVVESGHLRLRPLIVHGRCLPDVVGSRFDDVAARRQASNECDTQIDVRR